MVKTWFIIREKNSGKHLPCRTGRTMSYTALKLTDEKPPRLFAKRGHATQAMACWKKGILMPKYVEPREDQLSNWGLQLHQAGIMDEDLRTNSYVAHAVQGRENTDLEVVEITIGDFNG